MTLQSAALTAVEAGIPELRRQLPPSSPRHQSPVQGSTMGTKRNAFSRAPLSMAKSAKKYVI